MRSRVSVDDLKFAASLLASDSDLMWDDDDRRRTLRVHHWLLREIAAQKIGATKPEKRS